MWHSRGDKNSLQKFGQEGKTDVSKHIMENIIKTYLTAMEGQYTVLACLLHILDTS
jgi:hypothetical protein